MNKTMNAIRNIAFAALTLTTIFTAPSTATAACKPSTIEQAVASPEAAPAWRTFASRCSALRFARCMQRKGYFTNVFYDPRMGWWVVEF